MQHYHIFFLFVLFVQQFCEELRFAFSVQSTRPRHSHPSCVSLVAASKDRRYLFPPNFVKVAETHTKEQQLNNLVSPKAQKKYSLFCGFLAFPPCVRVFSIVVVCLLLEHSV